MANSLLIKASMLRDWVTCRRRVWLDHYADEGEKDALPPITIQRLNDGIRHEARVHQVTTPNARRILVRDWPDGVKKTRQSLREGILSLENAYLEAYVTLDEPSCTLRVLGKADRLQRVEGSARRYAPIEIKSYRQIGLADYLQLDCYLWLIGQIEGVQASDGEFWLGQDAEGLPRQQISHALDEARLFNAFHELARILLDPQTEPDASLASHCKTCAWHSRCWANAEAQMDISLISGLRQDTRQALHQAGIRTLNQLVELPPQALRRFPGIDKSAEVIHAQARAWVERRAIWHAEVPPVVGQAGWMFDLETVEYSEEVWSIGWSRGGQTQVAIVAPGREGQYHLPIEGGAVTVTAVSDSASAWHALVQAVAVDDAPLFHWTHYDATIFRKTAPPELLGLLEGRLQDLHKLFKQCVKLPTEGSSLKIVARYLGFRWSGYDDFFLAYVDYRKWLESGDLAHLASAIAYQRDDALALEVVRQWMAGGE